MMKKKAGNFGPAHSHDIQEIVAIVVLIVLVLIALWYVRVAPLPHNFP